MLGPLPALHRFLLVLAALVVCIGIGLWFGVMPELPLNLRVGLLAGTGAGAAAAFVLVHDFHQRQSRAARVRVATEPRGRARACWASTGVSDAPSAPASARRSSATAWRSAWPPGRTASASAPSSVASGLSVAQTCVLSLLMFTGASQFALVGVVAAGGAPVSGAATALLLGTRNTLYGLRMAPLLRWRGWRRLRRPPTC